MKRFTIIHQLRTQKKLTTKFKWWEKLAAKINRTKPEILFKDKVAYSYRITLQLDMDYRGNGGRLSDLYLIGNDHWLVVYSTAGIIDVVNVKPHPDPELRGIMIPLSSVFVEGQK